MKGSNCREGPRKRPQETAPGSAISRNRNKRNGERNHSGAHRGYDKNSYSAQNVKLLPHNGHYSRCIQRVLCTVGVTVRRERRWTLAGATPARELVRSTR